MSTTPARTRRAVSRGELIVLLVVIVIVIGLLLPAVQRTTDVDQARVQSINNLKQMCLALHNIASTYGGTQFPPSDGYIGTRTAENDFSGTVFTHMLPYIDSDPLYKQIRAGDVSQGSPPAIRGAVRSLKWKTYIAPADPSYDDSDPGTTSYASNAQALGGNGISIKDITDGTSNTVAIAERYARPALSDGSGPPPAPHYWINQLGGPGRQIPSSDPKYPATPAYGPTFYTAAGLPQIKPPIAEADEAYASGPSVGTVQVGMLDGSVRGVSAGVSLATWQAAHTPNGKDELGTDW